MDFKSGGNSTVFFFFGMLPWISNVLFVFAHLGFFAKIVDILDGS